MTLRDTTLREHLKELGRVENDVTANRIEIAKKVEEAPADGTQYARKNRAWIAVAATATSTGGGSVSCDIDGGTILDGTTEIDCGGIA